MSREDDTPILDAWTSLSYKRALGNRQTGGVNWVQPTWVGHHDRRLQAYALLDAIASNAGRYYLPDIADRGDHREYGDAGLIVETILSALLGDEQHIVTDGASDFDPEDGGEQVDENGVAIVPEPLDAADAAAQAIAAEAFAFQEWITKVLEDQEFALNAMFPAETDAVKLGDGAYTILWDFDKQRAQVEYYDPGTYFPVLDSANANTFPKKIHFAWEIPDDDPLKDRRKVQRRTFELRRLSEMGEAERAYAWLENGKTSDWTCLYSDGIWTFDVGGKQTVDDFTLGDADWQVITGEDGEDVFAFEIDLAHDKMPVVHVPNTIAGAAHFGRSSLSLVAQILDDLSNADTDLQAASATTGKPPVVLRGAKLARNDKGEAEAPTYAAGEVWEVDAEGGLDVLDTSASLDALIKYVDKLLERLSINARIPASVLGRLKPGDVNSGIQLLLSFGPMRSMIQRMRLVRSSKYGILLKLVHVVSLSAQDSEANVPDTWVPTKMTFGRFLPEDVTGVVTQVSTAVTAKILSLETGIQMLIEVGLPIEDIIEEVRRIQERDYAGAAELLAATGDKQLVADYLGVELTPVAPVKPPTPGVDPTKPQPPAPAPAP